MSAAILDINCISEISPDKKIFDSLILPDGHTEIIKALVASHVQVQKKGDTDDGAGATISKHRTYIPYAADSIRGKGQGLLVLLHGAPGVGKTSTAECVAEYTEKPLYPITCGDIGTDPATLEHRLQWQFYLAQRWGAVLLLDEADIFLQARDISDLNRNSLVSVFLRVLEYYTGKALQILWETASGYTYDIYINKGFCFSPQTASVHSTKHLLHAFMWYSTIRHSTVKKEHKSGRTTFPGLSACGQK